MAKAGDATKTVDKFYNYLTHVSITQSESPFLEDSVDESEIFFDSFFWGAGCGVLFWTAGFDLIYSTLDHDFDRQHGVFNLVAFLGISRGLVLARVLHFLAVIFFVGACFVFPYPGFFFQCATALMGVILTVEHALVRPDHLKHVGHAFFTFNGIIALIMFIGALLDIYG